MKCFRLSAYSSTTFVSNSPPIFIVMTKFLGSIKKSSQPLAPEIIYHKSCRLCAKTMVNTCQRTYPSPTGRSEVKRPNGVPWALCSQISIGIPTLFLSHWYTKRVQLITRVASNQESCSEFLQEPYVPSEVSKQLYIEISQDTPGQRDNAQMKSSQLSMTENWGGGGSVGCRRNAAQVMFTNKSTPKKTVSSTTHLHWNIPDTALEIFRSSLPEPECPYVGGKLSDIRQIDANSRNTRLLASHQKSSEPRWLNRVHVQGGRCGRSPRDDVCFLKSVFLDIRL